MSVSRMRDSAAAEFSDATLRLLMVCCSRFWTAPRSARWLETCPIAESIVASAASAADWVLTSMPVVASPEPEAT
jgi:hypothetical protein